MKKSTELLLQIAAVVGILWFGWSLVSATVVNLIRANQRVAIAERNLVSCQQQPKK